MSMYFSTFSLKIFRPVVFQKEKTGNIKFSSKKIIQAEQNQPV